MDFLFIIRYLTYLTFLVKLLNHLFKLTYAINLLIESTALLAYGMSFFLINIHT